MMYSISWRLRAKLPLTGCISRQFVKTAANCMHFAVVLKNRREMYEFHYFLFYYLLFYSFIVMRSCLLNWTKLTISLCTDWFLLFYGPHKIMSYNFMDNTVCKISLDVEGSSQKSYYYSAIFSCRPTLAFP